MNERFGMGAGGAFLSKKDLSYLLTTAWEGGSNYWVEIAKFIPPAGMTYQGLRHAAWDAAPDEERESWADEGRDGRWPLYVFLPYLPPSVKWKVHFKANEGDAEGDLTPKSMREALSKLSKKYSHVVKRIKSEDYDASDADAWLQMAVLGDVIFG